MVDALYLIEHFDPADRRAWFSCDRQWTRRNVVENIADGQMECVVRVLEIIDPKSDRFDQVPGLATDVTRDIAEDVETYVLRNRDGQFLYNVLSFLQTNGLRTHEMAS